MRWLVFWLMAYLFAGLQVGASPLLRLGASDVRPDFLFILMVFIAATGPAVPVLWAALVLGLLVDLTTTQGMPGSVIIGPYALGFALGALLILQMRAMVYRRHPLTTALLTLLAGAATHLLATFLLTAHQLISSRSSQGLSGWSATDTLVNAFLVTLYSSVVTLLLTPILNPLMAALMHQVYPRGSQGR